MYGLYFAIFPEEFSKPAELLWGVKCYVIETANEGAVRASTRYKWSDGFRNNVDIHLASLGVKAVTIDSVGYFHMLGVRNGKRIDHYFIPLRKL